MSSSAAPADGLLNSSSADSGSSAPTRRDIARARRMSLSQVAAALDRDRNTVSKWLEQGCPAIERADRDTGKSWVLDIAEVVRWLEKRSAEAAAERVSGGGPDGSVSEGEAKRRRQVAKMVVEEGEAEEFVGAMARWSVIVDRVSADYAELRGRLMSVGDAVAARVERRLAAKTKEIVDTQIAMALKAMKVGTSMSPPLESGAPSDA